MSTSTTAVAAPVRASKPRSARRLDHGNHGYLFVAPFLLLFLALFLLPLAYAAYLSLFKEQLIGGTVFAGLDNYTRALGDDHAVASRG